jgi:hypothetical protein
VDPDRVLVKILALALIFSSAGLGADPIGPAVFEADFEDGVAWSPRPGMQTEVIEVSGHGRALHVWGESQSGWNYATSASFQLLGGHLYRFSGWMRLSDARPELPPYFKVEFTGGPSGRATTVEYDTWNGGWQELVAEFQAPAGTTGGWIAIEKGSDTTVAVDLYVDDVVVQEIDGYSPHPYHFDVVPDGLASLAATHPRLYLTAEDFLALRQKVAAEPYAGLLAEILAVAESGVRNGPPAYQGDGDPEQLWQRPVGNMMPHLCLSYRLTGDARFLAAAKDFMLASAAYPTWGLGTIDGTDLATGHQLYGMALCYDWLYDDLDAGTRQTVRDCLLRRGQFMFEQLLTQQVWWEDSYLQNHQWVDMGGLSAAGLALFGGPEDVDGWILLPLEKYRRVMQSLGPDGASHEGLPYWSYGLEYLLKFMVLARQLLGEDFFAGNAWFENTAYFRLYGMLPQNAWQRSNSLMTFADGPRYDWYGPEYMLRRLASEYRDGHAQWLADALDQANVCGSDARFLNLLWMDPSVAPVPPADLPTFRHFEDMGIVFLRSGWGGDEALFAFKCGPHIGRHAVERYSYDPGGGHVHPDAGSFLLFANGDWLIVDDGYTFKTTAFQNTALVNGIGQEGEGSAWFQGSILCAEDRGARITRADFGDGEHYLIGDATAAYRHEAGLSEFLRHVLYLAPSTWIIVDELTAGAPSQFELYFHADFPFESAGANSYRVQGTRGALTMTFLAPENAAKEAFLQQLIGTDSNPKGEIPALKVFNREPALRALFLSVLEAHPSGSPPQADPRMELDGSTQILVLHTAAGDRRWRLDPYRAVRSDRVLVEPSGPDGDGGDGGDVGDGGGGADADGGDSGAGGEEAGDSAPADGAPADGTADGGDLASDGGTSGRVAGGCGCHGGGEEPGMDLLVLFVFAVLVCRTRRFGQFCR